MIVGVGIKVLGVEMTSSNTCHVNVHLIMRRRRTGDKAKYDCFTVVMIKECIMTNDSDVTLVFCPKSKEP